MKCKSCKQKIPEGSLFCNHCGVRQGKLPKTDGDVRVPTPTKLKSGKWNIYLRAEGESITEDTEAQCINKAKAFRAGYLENKAKRKDAILLGDAMDKYIEDSSNILSPSTKRGYCGIRRNHFQAYMDVDIKTFTDWQVMLNDESKRYSPKSLHNAWGFVCAVLRANNIQPPHLKQPRKTAPDLPWLDYEQIPKFIEAIHGQSCELAALLALSSLRRSELFAVTPDHVANDGSSILVSGARVLDENHHFVHKKENKTTNSERRVPVLIPRLQELLKNIDRSSNEFIVNYNPNTLVRHLNKICVRNGLPPVGFHGLRRSFASLGHHLGLSEQEVMLIGGWDDYQTIHKHYLKLAEKDLKKGQEKLRDFYS